MALAVQALPHLLTEDTGATEEIIEWICHSRETFYPRQPERCRARNLASSSAVVLESSDFKGVRKWVTERNV